MIPTTPIISDGMDALRLPAFFEDFKQCSRLAAALSKLPELKSLMSELGVNDEDSMHLLELLDDGDGTMLPEGLV